MRHTRSREDEDATLVTADTGQREVAEAAGVEVLWIDPAAG